MAGRLMSTGPLLVALLLVGCAGCGGCNDAGAPTARDVCGVEAGKLDGPTTRLAFRGDDEVVADVQDLSARPKALPGGAELRGVGRDRIVIVVPTKHAANARLAAKTGHVALYDWEANVVGPGGKAPPADPKVPGGRG